MRTSRLCAAIALGLVAGTLHAASLHPIEVGNGYVTGLTKKGRIASVTQPTGSGNAPSFRWDAERGLQPMDGFGDATAGNWAQPIAGSVVDAEGFQVAALHYSNSELVGGPVVIGAYPGSQPLDGLRSLAYGVSANGVAVGLAFDETGNAIAFRWTAEEGMERLAVNRPDAYSRANAVSGDGRVIVGWNDQDDGYRSGVVWIDGVPLDLTTADGQPVGEAQAVNHDGSVVVGGGYPGPDGGEAWRWTAETGVQPLGMIPVAGWLDSATAFGVSDDGDVVAGATGFGFDREAFVWTPDDGMQLISQYAAQEGLPLPADTRLAIAVVSADGRTFGGNGVIEGVNQAYVLDLNDDTPRDVFFEAQGTVAYNDLATGPFAGATVGAPVRLTFTLSPSGTTIEPAQASAYPIRMDTAGFIVGDAVETLPSAPPAEVVIANDYPKSDGIHLFATPTASGQTLEFEAFNPGGDLFDSDDVDRIDRTFGPEHFEAVDWNVLDGDGVLSVQLVSVSLFDDSAEPLPGIPLENGALVRELGGAAGTTLLYRIEVPEGARNLRFLTAAGSGDVTLYARLDAPADAVEYDLVSGRRPGNNETIRITNPAAGVWYVAVVGETPFARTTLRASYTP
ncbi:pre-peptidase C-terminal domain-containing protein [Coralloluteibacterium stylophorae]|uniref:Pre-peptidase C-terminal domain-containing protein n=1 Tax=Coralloluteibacterium stylophorae TaxID=1776034 RepID=A0A8J7VT89_9GAMM|nr:pre-peptidase C-terminal domain-containing protein [Coralloluteibacterium stylophorae]MBS7456842.1 pre-peptidase C-terminal domain-containing protein [Coralloluteibacterium stylophorae]